MDNNYNKEKPLRILHLEDSAKDAEIIREWLIDAGFSLQLDLACNEQEFTSSLQHGGYDLILADYLLPRFDAPAALLLAKSLCPSIPFIVVTGAIGEEKAVDLLKRGATDYVLKARLAKLPLAIERALDEVRAHEARRLAEGALRESETKYRRIVETASEGIWLIGPDTMTTFVNVRIAEMLGYTGAEMVGRAVTDFMFEEDAPNHLRKMDDRRQGLAEHYERRFRRKDGETVWTLASATPIFDDKQHFQGAFAMFTDITERKLADEELRRFKDELEQRVQERTAELEAKSDELEQKNRELERFNKLFVNRELKMVELKERIRELESNSGKTGDQDDRQLEARNDNEV